MENTVRLPEGALAAISDASLDFDLMDELLSEDAWLGIPNSADLLQQGSPYSPNSFLSSYLLPHSKIETGMSYPGHGDDARLADLETPSSSQYPPQDGTRAENMIDTLLNPAMRGLPHDSVQASVPGEAETSSSLRTEPSADPDPISSLKERVVRAIGWIKEAHRDGDVLVQIWVPTKKENQQVLTTYGQPFSLNPNCQRLMDYRTISTSYQFSAEENSDEVLGLPGRVFVGKLPEWSPDVRYFSSQEYARVSYAQHFDVRGTLALPIFERSNRPCIGVLEVVMTTEKINYRSDLENICNALQVWFFLH